MHSRPAVASSDDDSGDVWRARFAPPDNEAPAVIAASGVIGRSADAAVLLSGVACYTRGVAIDLAIRRRVDPEPADVLHASSDAGLLVGVELADGRTVVAGHDVWSAPPAVGEPTLVLRSAGGGGREWAISLWLAPAPPPGDLVVVVAHPALAVDEASVRVDAESLRVAAGRAEVLWPREPDRAEPALPPVRTDVPRGGWFERALGAVRPDEPAG